MVSGLDMQKALDYERLFEEALRPMMANFAIFYSY